MLRGHTDYTYALDFAPDAPALLSVGYDGQVILWDLRARDGAPRGLPNPAQIQNGCFSPDGRKVAGGGPDGSVAIWDFDAGGPPRLLAGHTQSVRGVDFSPDGKHLVSASEDHTVRVWDLADGTSRVVAELASGGPVVYAAGGRVLAVVDTPALRLFDAATGASLPAPTGFAAALDHVSASRASSLIAVSGSNPVVHVIDVETGRRWPLAGHRTTRQTAISRDGKTIVTTGAEGTVRVWDAPAPRERVIATGAAPTRVVAGPGGFAYGTDPARCAWSAGTAPPCAPSKG